RLTNALLAERLEIVPLAGVAARCPATVSGLNLRKSGGDGRAVAAACDHGTTPRTSGHRAATVPPFRPPLCAGYLSTALPFHRTREKCRPHPRIDPRLARDERRCRKIIQSSKSNS